MKLKTDKDDKKEKPDIKNKTKIIFILGIAGILLIFLSEIIPSGDKDTSKKSSSNNTSTCDETDAYKESTEKQLKELLENVNGVGECDVMVTVEGTTEYVYAQNQSEFSDSDGGKVSDKKENNIVVVEKDGEKQALVKKIIKPQISGVVIVCKGGGDLSVKERVLNAASTALNLPANKICVENKD